MALATLSIDLEARLAKLEEGMSRATRVAERNAAAIEARYARIGGAVRTVAGVVATAFAGVSLAGLVRNTVNGVDALDDLKDATGSSIENLSALEDIAARTGTGFDEMASTLVRFNKVLADAKPGSEGASIFKSLGLDVERLRALDPAEALRQVAEALAKFRDDGTKARIVQELFGKSVRDAAPLLNELAKAGKLNATYTTEQAEEVKKFNQQLLALEKSAKDASRALLSELVPALNRFALELVAGKEAFGGFWSALGNIGTSRPFDNALEGLNHYQRQLADLRQKERDAQASPGLFGNAAKLNTIRAEVADVERFIRYYERLLQLQGSAGAGRGFGFQADKDDRPDVPWPDDKRTPAKAKEIDDATRSLAQYVGELDRELNATKDVSEEQKALNFLKALGTRGEIPQVRELVLRLAAEVDMRRDVAGQTELQAKAQDALNRKQAESRRAFDDLLSQTPAARGLEILDLTAQLDEQFLAGKISATAYADAVAILNKRIDELKDPAKKAAKELDEFSKQGARNIQTALGDTVLATLKGDFDSIGRLWSNLIQRMVAEALGAELGRLLMGDFAKPGGSIGGLFGSFLGLFMHQGGIAGIDGKPTRYHGGGVAGLRADEVPAILQRGEEILPRSDRRHRNNGGLAQGGGRPIHMPIYVDGGMNRNEVFAAIQLAMNALRGEVSQTLRAAGVA